MSMATQNNITCSICSYCYLPLGKDNEPTGLLQCGHCVHESCYLSSLQEAVFQNDKVAQPECPTCKEKIMSFTRMFLEPYSLRDPTMPPPDPIPHHDAIEDGPGEEEDCSSVTQLAVEGANSDVLNGLYEEDVTPEGEPCYGIYFD